MDDKCKGCPFNRQDEEPPCYFGYEYEGMGEWVEAFDDCHLTPADQRIIKAMIDGEWKCESCKFADAEEVGVVTCDCSGACICWQPKGGEQDVASR